MIIDLQVPKHMRYFLSCGTTSFSWRTLLHGFS